MKKFRTKFSDLLSKRYHKTRRSIEKVKFNFSMNRKTLDNHKNILLYAEDCLNNKQNHESDAAYLSSTDPVVIQGYRLKKELELKFSGYYANDNTERIMIHVPSPAFSPAGYSLFTNIAESFSFIGISTYILKWDEDTRAAISAFCPTVFLTSDSEEYLKRIDWKAILEYKKASSLLVGLTASLEAYDNTPLLGRIEWAKKHEIDFYYSFRDSDYVQSRFEYQEFFKNGYKILFLPFGANILHYYPVAGIERRLDYALIATRKREHIEYLGKITSRYSGFIDGPGWKHTKGFIFNRERDKYIYAQAKIGLNIHLPEQLNYPCELNERTYQLAACGIPQLTDHALLLDKIFSKGAILVADSPNEYFELFRSAIGNPSLLQSYALQAQKEVFKSHTTFHRAESFVQQLKHVRKG